MESPAKGEIHPKPIPGPSAPSEEKKVVKILTIMPASQDSTQKSKSVLDTLPPPNQPPKIHSHRILSEWELGEKAEEEALANRNCILLSQPVLGTYSLSDPKRPPPPLDLDILHYLFMVVGLEKMGWHEINSIPVLLWKHFGVDLNSALVKLGEELDEGGPNNIYPTPIQPIQFWTKLASEYDGVMEVVNILVTKKDGHDATGEEEHFLYFPRIPGAKKRREDYFRIQGAFLPEDI